VMIRLSFIAGSETEVQPARIDSKTTRANRMAAFCHS
jgi:hypothetical protein